MKVKVAQSRPALCDPKDFTVHGIFQARILEGVAFPYTRGIFPTQGSNWGLLHCRWILYQLSYQGNPRLSLNPRDFDSELEQDLKPCILIVSPW